MAPKDINDFNKRLKRISNPRNVSYYDPTLEMRVPKRVSPEKIRRQAEGEQPSLGGFLTAMLLGAIALVAAQAVRFRYLEMTAPDRASLFADLLIGSFVVLAITAVAGYRIWVFRFAQVLGMIGVLAAGHNLVWAYPGIAGVVYSPQGVDIIQDRTTDRTVVLGPYLVNF